MSPAFLRNYSVDHTITISLLEAKRECSHLVGMLPKCLLLLRNKIVVACYPHIKWVILPMSQGAKEGRLSIRGHTQEKVEIKGFIHAIDKT
jgi:hypothetical protein